MRKRDLDAVKAQLLEPISKQNYPSYELWKITEEHKCSNNKCTQVHLKAHSPQTYDGRSLGEEYGMEPHNFAYRGYKECLCGCRDCTLAAIRDGYRAEEQPDGSFKQIQY